MKAIINHERREVYLDPERDIESLKGWTIYVQTIRTGNPIPVDGIFTLADTVRRGPSCHHTCPQHKEEE